MIWAVDALAEDKKLQDKIVKFLKVIAPSLDCEIEPVFILTPDQLKVEKKAFPAKAGTLHIEAEKRLNDWMKKVKIKGLLPPTIMLSSDYSLRSGVKALLEEAKKKGATCIAASTLARKGASRFLLGSFAETLVLMSDIPVLLVQPKSTVGTKVSKILFPTDFSENSKRAFQQAAQFAKSVGAQMLLFHQIEYLNAYTMEPLGGIPNYQQYFNEDKLQKTKLGNSWIEEIGKSGVKGKFLLGQKAAFSAEAILAVAKKEKPSLIAMASESGAVLATLLGSTTRQVLRHSTVPMWIVHPHKAH